jgi:L-fuconolactonase
MSKAKKLGNEELAVWRNSVVEEVIWPELPICDAHHHLWDHTGDRYYAAELAADIGDGHNITQTVYVECGSDYRPDGPAELAPIGEVEFVVGQEQQLQAILGRPLITGIIGFADLRRGNAVEDVLSAHIEVADGRFAGVRHSTAWDENSAIVNHQLDPPARLLRDPSFIAGAKILGQLGLSYDAWIYHPQLPELISFAREVQGTTVVLDHLGAPLGIGPYAGRREEILSFCREQLVILAAEPNVQLKLGGIGMTLYGNGWHKQVAPPSSEDIARSWGDHIRWCIDIFGPDRVIFESNFPPDRRSCSYRTLWNAFKRIAEPYSAQERASMFHDTAVAVYKL